MVVECAINDLVGWLRLGADRNLHLGKEAHMQDISNNPFIDLQWPVNKAPPSASRSSLMLGLMLNAEHFDAVIDTGPSADKPEVSGCPVAYNFLCSLFNSFQSLCQSGLNFLFIF